MSIIESFIRIWGLSYNRYLREYSYEVYHVYFSHTIQYLWYTRVSGITGIFLEMSNLNMVDAW
jgi:hypothetical protein